MKQCKCGRKITSQPDKSKASIRIEFAKSKDESGLLYVYQAKHTNWDCDYCKRKKLAERRKRKSKTTRMYYK